MEFSLESASALQLAAQHRLDPNLLHKESKDDVLLCYGHGAIPARLNASTLTKVSEEDARFLLTHYVKNEDAADGWYYLKSIPVFIADAEAAALQDAEEDRALLETHYAKNDNGYVINADYVPEMDEILLLKKLNRIQTWVPDSARCKISQILEADGIPENHPRTMYAMLYNDLSNYYFYKKHHEHVPGIMTIEAARQTVYAHHYRYSGFKRGEVSISIANLNIDFLGYTNSNYPVRIVMDDVGPNARPDRWLHKRATFYQCGRKIAKFELCGPVIKAEVFKKARVVPIDETHQFEPVKNILRTIHLTGADERRYECELNTLSAKGLQVSFKPKAAIKPGDVFDFALYAKHIGFMNAKAEITAVHPGNKTMIADLHFLALGREDKTKLSEIIKNFTHVVSAQGVF
ncbi:MAG: hypothetical protein M0P19_04855 [Nevskia sp.]|jgi:hypothetical protein|nr:hypothetical protein [Nevskia sp.]MCK9384026.1 hypothetical protein [Nevskia sp.]